MTPEARKALLTEQVEALQSLSTHPGWEILCKHLKGRTDVLMTEMKSAPSQEVMLKATYTYLALHDLPAAPAMMLQVLTQQLQQLQTTRK